MNIGGINPQGTLHQAGAGVSADGQANKRQDTNKGGASPAVQKSAENTAAAQTSDLATTSKVKDALFGGKGVIAIDKDTKEVVIQILDSKGNLVKQIPPKDFLDMMQQFDENVKNLFSKKV
jgi:uncharacterized FlaG/YvyC family protein